MYGDYIVGPSRVLTDPALQKNIGSMSLWLSRSMGRSSSALHDTEHAALGRPSPVSHGPPTVQKIAVFPNPAWGLPSDSQGLSMA